MATERRREEAWFERALVALHDSGPAGQASAAYIRQRRIRLGFARQKHSGACWFDWRRLRFGVFLNSSYVDRRPDDPWLSALLAHEARHLEQGLVEALSVRGELLAWQLEYDVLQALAEPLDDTWRALRALDPNSRADLEQARALMKQLAGPGYCINWLPLYPLPAEVAHRLKDLGRRILR